MDTNVEILYDVPVSNNNKNHACAYAQILKDKDSILHEFLNLLMNQR